MFPQGNDDSILWNALNHTHISHIALRWRRDKHDGVSNHQCLDGLFIRLSRRRSKKISKLRVTGLCEGNSPVTGEFPVQSASNAEIFPFDDVIMALD